MHAVWLAYGSLESPCDGRISHNTWVGIACSGLSSGTDADPISFYRRADLLNEDQVRQMSDADEVIEFVDSAGNRLGVLARSVDLEDVRIARKRLESKEDRSSYSELLDHLASLDAP